MIGLLIVAALGVALLLAGWVFVWAYRVARRSGKSDLASFMWASLAVVVLSLPITWDAIPTWIAFNHYKKLAGVTVYKTLEQWKLENPGLAETLESYGSRDQRGDSTKLGDGKSRYLVNARFAHEDQYFEKLFLSVYANRFALIDVRKNEVLVGYVEIGSGNAGGLATGGQGWWAFWLINQPSKDGVTAWSDYVNSVRNMGISK